MSFMSSLFGGSGGARQADIQKAVSVDQANGALSTTKDALAQQNAFLQALQAQGGLGHQNQVYDQQQALANQLQGVANGTGPNPALAQLHQATGANVANQAALMAGQRGTGANAGLLARQAGQQGANIQQQAVGQGATLQAQQQLAGLQALQNQQNMLGQMANTQVGQQQSGLQQYNQNALGEQSTLLNSINAQNNAAVGNATQFNNALAGQQKMGMQVIGAGANAIGGAGSMAHGGEVHSSNVGRYLANPSMFAKGGQVPAMVSPGERYLSPEDVKKVAHGKSPMSAGEKIPGKAKVKGDSLKNDTVPKKLEEGGIVLPRSVTEHKDAPEQAKRFVMAIIAKNKMGKK